MRKDDPAFNEERHRALDQVVKTVLLAEVSSRLRQSGMTIERLVQLNSADVEGEGLRGKVRVAETDLLALSHRVPDLQVAGAGKTAIVRYVLGRVGLSEFVARARSKVDNQGQRFKVFWGALKKALGIEGLKGFEENGTDGDWDLTWRRTKRRGRLKLGNVRELTYEDFVEPPGTFRVVVDYPWDEPGHTVDEDRLKAANVRKSKGALHTACWLPRHMTTTELATLTEIAAVRLLQSEAGQELLDTLGPQDRSKVLDAARVREHTLVAQLDECLKEVYIRHGEFVALISDVDRSRPHPTLAENLEHIATLLMDRRYPQHPHFVVEPRKADLDLLLQWMISAGDATTSVPFDDATGKALRNLGVPLEIVNIGQTKASLRVDSRFIKDVLARVDQDSLPWGPVAEHLRTHYGFTAPVIDLFLCFLCQRDHRALRDGTDEPIAVSIGMTPTPIRLQRGRLVEAAQWGRLRDLGATLFGLQKPTATRSLQSQDRFAQALQQAGKQRREALQGLHQRLVHLGVAKGDRLAEVATANARLAPLAQNTTDSHKMLVELLAQWPEQADDPILGVVQSAALVRGVILDVDEEARKNLAVGMDHPDLGVAVGDHLAQLERHLACSEREMPITKKGILDWNERAKALVRELLKQPVAKPVQIEYPTPPIDPGTPGSGFKKTTDPTSTDPPSNGKSVLLIETVDVDDGDALSIFIARVRDALEGQGGAGAIRVALVREEAP